MPENMEIVNITNETVCNIDCLDVFFVDPHADPRHIADGGWRRRAGSREQVRGADR